MESDTTGQPLIKVHFAGEKEPVRAALEKHVLALMTRTNKTHSPLEFQKIGLLDLQWAFWLEEHAIEESDLPPIVAKMRNFLESHFQNVAVEEKFVGPNDILETRVKFIVSQDWETWQQLFNRNSGAEFERFTNTIYICLNDMTKIQQRLALFGTMLHELRHRLTRRIFEVWGEKHNAEFNVTLPMVTIRSPATSYPVLEEVFTVAYEVEHIEPLLEKFDDESLLQAWQMRKDLLKSWGSKEVNHDAVYLEIGQFGEIMGSTSNYEYYFAIYKVLGKYILDLDAQFMAIRRGEKGAVSALVQSIVRSLGKEALLAITYGHLDKLAQIYLTLLYCEDLKNPDLADKTVHIKQWRDAALRAVLKKVVAEDHPVWKSLKSANS